MRFQIVQVLQLSLITYSMDCVAATMSNYNTPDWCPDHTREISLVSHMQSVNILNKQKQ